MIDIGVNLNHKMFLDDVDATLTEMKDAGVKGMICIASDFHESKQIQALSQVHSTIWNTIGCHPHQAKTWHSIHCLTSGSCQSYCSQPMAT